MFQPHMSHDVVIANGATNVEIAGLSRLVVRGRFERARRYLAQLLDRYPTDPRLLSQRARLDAETKRITFADAETAVRELVTEHPGDQRLQATAAYLVSRQGSREAAVAELRELAAQTDEPYVHQTLAGLLHLTRSTWGQSWEHYQRALEAGPLGSPCYRSAAYLVARSIEPEKAATALQGAGRFERAAVRSRARGPKPMFLIAEILAFGAAGIRIAETLPLALTVMVVATLWMALAVYANHIVCCHKCRNTWISTAAFLWVIFELTPRPITAGWLSAIALSTMAGNLWPSRIGPPATGAP
jgi:tetratricopeptide (TPR) repeat protein